MMPSLLTKLPRHYTRPVLQNNHVLMHFIAFFVFNFPREFDISTYLNRNESIKSLKRNKIDEYSAYNYSKSRYEEHIYTLFLKKTS